MFCLCLRSFVCFGVHMLLFHSLPLCLSVFILVALSLCVCVLQAVLAVVIVVNLQGILGQFREVPVLWASDRLDLVCQPPYNIHHPFCMPFSHSDDPSLITPDRPLIRGLSCVPLPTAGVGVHPDLHPDFQPGSWPGCCSGPLSDHCRLQDSTVSVSVTR